MGKGSDVALGRIPVPVPVPKIPLAVGSKVELRLFLVVVLRKIPVPMPVPVPMMPLPVGAGVLVKLPLVVGLREIPVPVPIIPFPDKESNDEGKVYDPWEMLAVGSEELIAIGVALIVPRTVALLDTVGKPPVKPALVALLEIDGLPEGVKLGMLKKYITLPVE